MADAAAAAGGASTAEQVVTSLLLLPRTHACIPSLPPPPYPPQVLRVVPYSAAQLYSYEVFKKLFADDAGELPVQRRLLAGACAGMAATLVRVAAAGDCAAWGAVGAAGSTQSKRTGARHACTCQHPCLLAAPHQPL